MNQQQLWVLAKKEFFGYVNSVVAYVVMVPFLVLNAFLFMRTALVMGDANLRPMIELLPWFLMIIGPALTMKTFADEKRKDTVELLFAHPVSTLLLVVGKYLGIMMFYGLMLVATLPLAATIMALATPDWGLLIGQYLGALMVGGVFLAIGVTMSTIVGSAVGSFLASIAINFVLMLLGLSFVTLMLPGPVGRIVTELALTTHVNSISRGVIDLRDVLYFATVIGVTLLVAVMKLSERIIAEIPAEKRKLGIIMTLMLVVGILGNLVVYQYPMRWDLTSDHRYSLSAGTKKLLKELPDRVTISLYESQNLPGPMQVTVKEVNDWLSDFKRYGKKVNVRVVNVDSSPANKTEALGRGIREIQFNQIGSSSFQVQTGVLGLEVRFGTKTKVIDFIEDSGNLEYQLGRMLTTLTRETKPKVGLLTASATGAIQTLDQMISEQYELVPLSDASKPEALQGLAGLLVVDDGSAVSASGSALLKSYLASGGNVAMFADGVNVEKRQLTTSVSKSKILDVLKDWGMTVNPNLVYDTQYNEAVTLGSGSVRYMLPYPFWMRAIVKKTDLGLPATLTNALVGWASTITVVPTEGVKLAPLLATGPKTGGVQEGKFTILPAEVQKLTGSSEQVVGVVAMKQSQRLVVLADAEVVMDDFLQSAAENQILVANVVDWMVADPILNQIPKRGVSRNLFKFGSMLEVQVVQYGNIIGPAVVVAAMGGWWLWRRKKMTKRTWSKKSYAN